MFRSTMRDLKNWQIKPNRKPLVVRGARQVGKTYLIRQFGSECFQNTVELNFEKQPELAQLFVSKDPEQILPLIELQQDTVIKPRETLLFLDEIQAAPQVFEALRYFFEERPDVHVVAAGGNKRNGIQASVPRHRPDGERLWPQSAGFHQRSGLAPGESGKRL